MDSPREPAAQRARSLAGPVCSTPEPSALSSSSPSQARRRIQLSFASSLPKPDLLRAAATRARCLKLNLTPCRNGKAPAHTKCLLGSLQHRRGLLPFVLCLFDQPNDRLHQLPRDILHRSNLVGGSVVFDIRAKNRIEHLIRRQRIRVLLPRPQLRRRFLID